MARQQPRLLAVPLACVAGGTASGLGPPSRVLCCDLEVPVSLRLSTPEAREVGPRPSTEKQSVRALRPVGCGEEEAVGGR